MIILIDNLIPTQNWLRYEPKTIGPQKISLTRTEDNLLYVWNGHHKLFALWQAGYESVLNENVSIVDMTYAQLKSINFDKGYVTPFDPKTECRLEDFIKYKADINELYHKFSYQRALYHITNRSNEYREQRLINHVSQLRIKQKEETYHDKTPVHHNNNSHFLATGCTCRFRT